MRFHFDNNNNKKKTNCLQMNKKIKNKNNKSNRILNHQMMRIRKPEYKENQID